MQPPPEAGAAGTAPGVAARGQGKEGRLGRLGHRVPYPSRPVPTRPPTSLLSAASLPSLPRNQETVGPAAQERATPRRSSSSCVRGSVPPTLGAERALQPTATRFALKGAPGPRRLPESWHPEVPRGCDPNRQLGARQVHRVEAPASAHCLPTHQLSPHTELHSSAGA